MKETSKIFFEKLFNPDEEICVSPNKYAFSSIPISQFGETMILESQNMDRDMAEVKEDDIVLVAMNPIKGDRADYNCTAFRTFLIELDGISIEEQKAYIEGLGLPYTVCIFSGNKSLHYGITLSEDITTEELWRDINEWILAVVSQADQQTKNPSRSIRFPGNQRKDGKCLMQEFVDVRERVDFDQLLDWLDQYPDKNPRIKKMLNRRSREPMTLSTGIPKWIGDKLNDGVGRVGSRNAEWFQLSMELAKRGYTTESIIEALGPYFAPDRDFTLREWNTIIKSAVKRVERGIHE